MHNFLLVVFSTILSGEIFILSVLHDPKPKPQVLSTSVINTPSASPTFSPSPTASPSPSPSPKPTPSPSPTPSFYASPKPTVKVVTPTPLITPANSPTASPSPTLSLTATPSISPIPALAIPDFSSAQINEFINKYAAQYSVSPDVLRHVALCESGFNPKASHLSYAGLFQYGPTTWINVRTKMGEDSNINLRYHAEEAVQTAAYHFPSGKSLWPTAGHDLQILSCFRLII